MPEDPSAETVEPTPPPLKGTRFALAYKWARETFVGTRTSLDEEKHHESNIVWGPLSVACSIVITVIGAMKHDLRWLLIVAWPLLSVGIWRISKAIPYPTLGRSLTVVLSVVIGIGFFGLSTWLKPLAESSFQQETDFAISVPIIEGNTGQDGKNIVPIYGQDLGITDQRMIFFGFMNGLIKDSLAAKTITVPTKGDGLNDFLADLVSYMCLRWIDSLESDSFQTGWSYKSGVGTGFTPGVLPPEPVLFPKDQLRILLSNSKFAMLRAEAPFWSGANLDFKVPGTRDIKATGITLRVAQTDRSTPAVYTLSLQGDPIYKVTISSMRGPRIDNFGLIPSGFQLTPQDAARTKTYSVVVRCHLLLTSALADSLERQQYVTWAQGLFDGLRKTMQN